MTLRLDQVKEMIIMGDGGILIEMYYLPTLSVNHYKIAHSYVTRREVTAWMEQLAWACGVLYHQTKINPPITIGLSGCFKDKRYPDLANLHKVIGDSVENGLGIDDKHFRFHDGEVQVGAREPYLTITIRGR